LNQVANYIESLKEMGEYKDEQQDKEKLSKMADQTNKIQSMSDNSRTSRSTAWKNKASGGSSKHGILSLELDEVRQQSVVNNKNVKLEQPLSAREISSEHPKQVRSKKIPPRAKSAMRSEDRGNEGTNSLEKKKKERKSDKTKSSSTGVHRRLKSEASPSRIRPEPTQITAPESINSRSVTGSASVRIKKNKKDLGGGVKQKQKQKVITSVTDTPNTTHNTFNKK